jgi:hypothetical protein
MSEPQRDFWYWSEPLVCITGEVSIDRREIAAVVVSPIRKPVYYTGNKTHEDYSHLDIHLKSGTIFTITQWDKYTVAHLLSMVELGEEVDTVPNTFTMGYSTYPMREHKAPEAEE